MKTISAFMSGRKRSQTHISRTFPKYQPGMSVAQYIIKFEELNKFRFDKQGASVLPYELSQYMHQAAIFEGPEVIAEAL